MSFQTPKGVNSARYGHLGQDCGSKIRTQLSAFGTSRRWHSRGVESHTEPGPTPTLPLPAGKPGAGPFTAEPHTLIKARLSGGRQCRTARSKPQKGALVVWKKWIPKILNSPFVKWKKANTKGYKFLTAETLREKWLCFVVRLWECPGWPLCFVKETCINAGKYLKLS